jgi:GT2 family glycosyltransferase
LIPQILGLDRLLPRAFAPHFMQEWPHDSTRAVDQVPGGFFLIRRPVFEAVGSFDERFFMYFEDVDLSLRVHQAGWQSIYFAGASAVHKGRGTTDRIKARRLAYFLTSRIRYTRKHFSPAVVGLVVVLSALVEILPRLLQKLLRGSIPGMMEVLRGYLLFWRGLPGTLREDPGRAS